MKSLIILLAFSLFINILSAQDGETIFDNSIVHTLEIVSNTTGNLVDSLVNRHLFEEATGESWSYMPVDAYFDGFLVDSIGIRIKGGYGSFSEIKPSLKLDFNEFVSGKKYDGLKKVNVDNCIYDPSLMREKLYNDIASEIGLCSSRTSFVKVTIDGEDYGTFVYIEQVNKEMLKRCFDNKNGNLFKTSAGGDLSYYGNTAADYAYYYDLKTNEDENDWSDLLLLIEKIAFTPNAEFKDTIAKYLNVESVLRYLAIGTYIVYSDNLFSRGNNGYWYHNTDTDKFELIPIDADLSFMDRELYGYEYTANHTELINPIVTRAVFGKILDVPEYQAQYLEMCCFIYNNLGNVDNLKAKIEFYESVLQNADIEVDENTAYTSFSDNSFPFIYDYTFLGLKDFAEKRYQKFGEELLALNVMCDNINATSELTDIESSMVYPNPARHSFFIKNVDYFDKIKIFDVFGKGILHVNTSSDEVKIEGLGAGVYFVLFGKGGRFFSEKVVIK